MCNKIITFGCRLNQYESEVIHNMLEKKIPNEKDNIIIHTCAVTKEAERQVKQKIRHIHKNNPDKKIIVIGCAIDINEKDYSSLSGVVKVLNNNQKLHHENYTDQETLISSESLEHSPVSFFTERTKALIKIQDGCNHSCTFCSITNARGKSRSCSTKSILSNIELLIKNGYKEISFTGVNISDFGQDLPEETNLTNLIKQTLNNFPELQRLRLSSIDIADVDEEMIEVITSEQRFAPHLHMSLQSGSNMILKRMKRRHTREQAINICHKIISKRKFTFGADIIAGFPTETEEMFADSVSILKQIPITHAHVFKYSPRPNTPASRMPQVNNLTKKLRTRILIQTAKQNFSELLTSKLGTKQNVLVEQNGAGYTENLIKTKFENKNHKEGDIITLTISKVDQDTAFGD